MKKIIIMLMFISFLSFCDEETSQIFETYKDAVVYVRHALYLDSSMVSNLSLIKKVEKELANPLLDNYYSLISGTGFFITDKGHIITNDHVAHAIEDMEDVREDAYWGLMEELSEITSEEMSYNDFEKVMDDFKVLFDKAEYSLIITANNYKHYKAIIMASDKDLDLALLKVTMEPGFPVIPIGDSDEIKAGNKVIAIGYPFQTAFDFLYKDVTSTLTEGIVSAIRGEKGIQHSASINPGNSGGPLLNMNGEAVGVNASYWKGGQNIYFAIPAKKLTEWLEASKHGDIVANNKSRATIFAGTRSTQKTTGSLEVGKSMFIKLEEKYNVYIDEEYKGETPVLISDLKEGRHLLQIESETQYHGRDINVNPARTDIVTYSPKMGKFTGNLFIESEPGGAVVYIDGKNHGKTPAAVSKITAEEHTLKIVLDGYVTLEEKITLKKKETLKLERSLEKAYSISFEDSLPKGTKIRVKGETFDKTYEQGDEIHVPAGSYTLFVMNSLFKEDEISVEIKDSDKKISFTPEYFRNYIRFVNLLPESRVFLDTKEITDKIEDNAYEVEVGEHVVRVETKTYSIHEERIVLEKDREAVIEVHYILSPSYLGKKYAWIGYPTLGAGLLVGIASFVLYLDDVAVTLTADYDGYVMLKWTSFGFLCAGTAAIIVGSVFTVLSIVSYNQAKKSTSDISFSIDFRDNVPVLYLHFHPDKDKEWENGNLLYTY